MVNKASQRSHADGRKATSPATHFLGPGVIFKRRLNLKRVNGYMIEVGMSLLEDLKKFESSLVVLP